MPKRMSIVGVVAAVLATACSPQPFGSPVSIFFPRHSLRNEGPTALLTGTIDIDDACVWIDAAPFRYLVLWPPDAQVAVSETGALEVLGPGLSARLRDGDAATLSGGEYKDEAFVRQMIGSGIPAPCRSDRCWLATGIQDA